MAVSAELILALKRFAAVERQIVTLGQRVDPANALEFVRMRRQLVMGFAEVGMALEKDPWFADRPDALRQGRQLFSAFRAANSINQANWPVVKAKDDPRAYEVAARLVADKSRAFWNWIEKELGVTR